MMKRIVIDVIINFIWKKINVLPEYIQLKIAKFIWGIEKVVRYVKKDFIWKIKSVFWYQIILSFVSNKMKVNVCSALKIIH